jgi:hypothetical protein
VVAVVRWIDGEAIDGFLKRLLVERAERGRGSRVSPGNSLSVTAI